MDCMVELVNGSKGFVVFSKSSEGRAEECITVFTNVVSRVMVAKAKFCHSIKPQFFLLDSSAESDYLNEDHQFAVSEVESALVEGNPVAISEGRGRGKLELSKLQFMRKLTHWNSLFPISLNSILPFLCEVDEKLTKLGVSLGVPSAFVRSLKTEFPFDVEERTMGLVQRWMSSSQDPPCWWTLAQALRDSELSTYAEHIEREHGAHIQLQEKMLDQQTQAKKPEEEFLCSLSGVVGSRWPSIAVCLALSNEEIEVLKNKVGLSQQELALQMLRIWASREEATYRQLCCKLQTISLFSK